MPSLWGVSERERGQRRYDWNSSIPGAQGTSTGALASRWKQLSKTSGCALSAPNGTALGR